MILYCHKDLHHRWSVGPRSAFDFFFLWETLLKRLNFNQVSIYILKVKKNSTKTRYEVCPKLPIKAPKRRKFCRSGVFIVNFVLCTFSILTLKSWMPVGTCCIHFHIYRSSHPEVFFKKGVIRKLDNLQKNIHANVPHGYSSVNMNVPAAECLF